ncbi:MAG TPA: hypothetical protein ENI95_04230 [Chloroflexi bacterium]|nr:hypothetical protein [Chloroflexota bacterium]
MWFLNGLRERIRAVIGLGVGAFLLLCFGAFLAFVISPRQALEWRRVNNLPQLDAEAYAALPAGEEALITGTLQGNQALTDDGLVAYIREIWEVEPPDPDSESEEPKGAWRLEEKAAPALTIAISGGTVITVPNADPSFAGNLHETLATGPGPLSARDGDRSLPDGSVRTRGFRDGDLITVLGRKASTGDLIPERLFAGDRVQLVEHIQSGARAAFTAGLVMIACAPLVLIGGTLAILFGRRRR